MKRIVMALIVGLTSTPALAGWSTKYTRELTKTKDSLSVERMDSGSIHIRIREHLNTLPAPMEITGIFTPIEAQELAHIILRLVLDGEPETCEYIEDFSANADVSIALKDTKPFLGSGHRHGKNIHINLSFMSDESAQRALDTMSNKAAGVVK